MARALTTSAVTCVGRDPNQGGELGRIDLAEFGHVGQQGGDQHWAGALEFPQAGSFAAQPLVLVDVLRYEPVGCALRARRFEKMKGIPAARGANGPPCDWTGLRARRREVSRIA